MYRIETPTMSYYNGEQFTSVVAAVKKARQIRKAHPNVSLIGVVRIQKLRNRRLVWDAYYGIKIPA